MRAPADERLSSATVIGQSRLSRFFAGLPIDDVASMLGVGTRTIDRDYLFAHRWLRLFLSQGA